MKTTQSTFRFFDKDFALLHDGAHMSFEKDLPVSTITNYNNFHKLMFLFRKNSAQQAFLMLTLHKRISNNDTLPHIAVTERERVTSALWKEFLDLHAMVNSRIKDN